MRAIKLTVMSLLSLIAITGCSTVNYQWVDITGQNRASEQLQMASGACGQQAFQIQQNVEMQHANDGCNTPACELGKVVLYEDTYNSSYNQCMTGQGWKLRPLNIPNDSTPPSVGIPANPAIAQSVKSSQSGAEFNFVAKPNAKHLSVMNNVNSAERNAPANNNYIFMAASNIWQAYVIRSSIRPHGKWTNVDVLINYHSLYRPSAGFLMSKYRSAKLYMAINCSKDIYSFVHETDFTQTSLGGSEVNDRHIIFQSNKTPASGQINGYVYAFICSDQ